MMNSLYYKNQHLNGNNFFHTGGRKGVLLFHGFTATTVEVRDLALFFSSRGCTVSAPLLPGHGTSPEDLNRTQKEDWIHCAESSLKNLLNNCDEIIVGGESMGALLAMYLCSLYTEIKALCVYSPALLVKKNSYAKYLQYFIKFKRKKKINDKLPWQGYTVYPIKAAVELEKLQKTVRTKISQINQPAVIFQGKFDKTIDSDNSEYIHRRISSKIKKMIWMENSGHVMLLDKEKELIFDLTWEFLKSNKIL